MLVPWERVFLYGDKELCNNVYGKTGAVVHMMHQVVAKNIAKTELLLGIACRMVDTIAGRPVPARAGEGGRDHHDLETMKALLRASEADGAPNELG